MSNGDNFNWTTLNQMLRDGELMQPTKSIEAKTMDFVYNDKPNCLRDGVKFIFENMDLIAQLEHQYNDGQPIECTLQHLRIAKLYCRYDLLHVYPMKYRKVDATASRPISDLVLQCFYTSAQNDYSIRTDSKRSWLIRRAFGVDQLMEANVGTLASEQRSNRNCTQIIFDSGDIESAVDALIANLSDRTIAQWRIDNVYVQETLRNQFDVAITDRLNAINSLQSSSIQHENSADIESMQKFGSKYIESNNKSIGFLFETLPKYVQTANGAKPPVTINYFRTAKELGQLVAGDRNIDGVAVDFRSTSIWTENVSLLYEMANNLDVKIVWANAIGVYHECMSENAVFKIGVDERFVVIQIVIHPHSIRSDYLNYSILFRAAHFR